MQRLTLGMAELPPDLGWFVNEAKLAAEDIGPYASLGARAGMEEAEEIVQREKHALGIQVERDPYHQAAIAKQMVPLLSEALLLQYDINDKRVQAALLNIAVEMHTSGYTPMRVLGATGEAFRR